jgi:hypothetical protein
MALLLIQADSLRDIKELLRSSSSVSSRQDWRGFLETPITRREAEPTFGIQRIQYL